MDEVRKNISEKIEKKAARLTKRLKAKCRHGRSLLFCCICRYGDIVRSENAYIQDSLDELSGDTDYRLKEIWKMLKEDEEW